MMETILKYREHVNPYPCSGGTATISPAIPTPWFSPNSSELTCDNNYINPMPVCQPCNLQYCIDCFVTAKGTYDPTPWIT